MVSGSGAQTLTTVALTDQELSAQIYGIGLRSRTGLQKPEISHRAVANLLLDVDLEPGLVMELFESELLDLIAQESGLQPAALKAANGLMSTGVLDSFALVTVITFVEEQIGGEVPPSDLTFENFDSIAGICSYVERARAA